MAGISDGVHLIESSSPTKHYQNPIGSYLHTVTCMQALASIYIVRQDAMQL